MVRRLKQQGMALLMALVMIAIASSLAAYIWFDSQLTLARINNLHHAYQAKHYGQGLLIWAGDILREDYAQDESQHDSFNDSWLQGIQGMVVEDAVISGDLQGLNGRFNVNNLIINGSQSELHVAYFRRLLALLDLDTGIADKIIDWIDADQLPEPNGAEDFVYLAKISAYSTASTYLQHTSELTLLDGLSVDDWNKLEPYVVAIPLQAQQPTKMNVNTMSPILIKALSTLITNDMAVRLNNNNQAEYQSMDDFFQQESVRYVLLDSEIKNQIKQLADVQTRELQASARVQMDDQLFEMYALLRRNSIGEARVLSRSPVPFIKNTLLE